MQLGDKKGTFQYYLFIFFVCLLILYFNFYKMSALVESNDVSLEMLL